MIQPLLKNKIDTKKKLLQKWYFLKKEFRTWLFLQVKEFFLL